MITQIIELGYNYLSMERKNRPGLDKPVFIVAAITLAIIFVSVYFSSVSGWMDNALTTFGERSSEVGPDP